jgi:hypothetical protein
MKKSLLKVSLVAMVVAVANCIGSAAHAMTMDENYILLNAPTQSFKSVASSQLNQFNLGSFTSGNNVYCGSVNLWGLDNFGALRVNVNVSSDRNYLVACYGSFTEVYDLSSYDKSKTFLLQFFDNSCRLTSWTAYSSDTPQTSVPDGGMTVILLGTALAGLGLFSKRVRA